MNQLSVSIVIPVYNEEHHIKACLDAIAAQTVKPLEVMVVDNNCTDKTIEIAKKYKFVKILHEQRQHQVYAQAKGFDLAKGDILARIDGDTIVPKNWVKQIQEEFIDNNVAAISGRADFYDMPLKKIGLAVFNFYQIHLMKLFTNKIMLWGSNCAFRSIHWPYVKDHMLFADKIWEDHEMSYWLADKGQVKNIPKLVVGSSTRSIHEPFFAQLAYQYRAIRVFGCHNGKMKTVIFFFAWYTMIPIFILAFIDRYILKFQNRKNI